MLGLSAIVAVLTQLLGLGVGYSCSGARLPSSRWSRPRVRAMFPRQWPACSGRRRSWSSSPGWRRWSSGIPTVVVSRAVLGERMTAGQAWQAARRLPRLLLLTLVYSLIWLSPFLVVTVIAIALGAVAPTEARPQR